MTRTIASLFVSLSVLACDPTVSGPDVVEGDGASGPPSVEDPAVEDPGADLPDQPNDPEAPSGSRSLTAEEIRALDAAFGGLPVELGEGTEIGQLTVTTLAATGAPATTVMDGVAVQTVDAGADFFEFTLLFGFTGLDLTTQTVDEAFVIYAPDLVDPGSAGLGDVSTTFDAGWALYIDEVAGETYFSTSGTFDIAAVTLDPATEVDCSTPSFSCSEIEGTLQGDLDMDSLGFPGAVYSNDPGMPSGTGTPLNVTVDFDVPLGRATLGPVAP